MSVKLDLNDLTSAALKRLVTQLLAAKDGDEQAVLSKLSGKKAPPKNDLADLHEEKHGSPNTPEVEEDDIGLDNEADPMIGHSMDDEETQEIPSTKRRKL